MKAYLLHFTDNSQKVTTTELEYPIRYLRVPQKTPVHCPPFGKYTPLLIDCYGLLGVVGNAAYYAYSNTEEN